MVFLKEHMKHANTILKLAVLTASALFAGCQFGLSPDVTSVEDEAIELSSILGASFAQQPVSTDMVTDLAATVLSPSATAPAGPDVDEYLLPTTGSSTYDVINDYPEFGWDTTVTIEKTATAGVYKVTSRSAPQTRYDRYLVESAVEEVYYVQDTKHVDGSAGADGYYNYHDSIYDMSGTSAWGSLYRERLAVTFDDGNVRNEVLVESSTNGGRTFALFPQDLRSADMTFPVEDYTPETITANDNTYSSVVIYTQQLNQDLNFWYGQTDVTPYLAGVRFYSEFHDVIRGAYTATTYVIEVVLDGDGTAPDLANDAVLANSVTRKVSTIDDETFAATRHDARMSIVFPDPGGTGSVTVSGNSGRYDQTTRIATRTTLRVLEKIVDTVLPPNFPNWTDVDVILGGDLGTGPITIAE